MYILNYFAIPIILLEIENSEYYFYKLLELLIVYFTNNLNRFKFDFPKYPNNNWNKKMISLINQAYNKNQINSKTKPRGSQKIIFLYFDVNSLFPSYCDLSVR